MENPTKYKIRYLKKRVSGVVKTMSFWYLSIIVVILLIIATTSLPKRPDTLTHISESSSIEAFNLSAHWALGNVVALVRHAERCDHSDHQCLDGDTGITSIGKDTAIKLGENFERFLPKDHTIFFNSPLKRTVQTSLFMFNGESTSQNWLHENCKERFLEDILKHKSDGINMVLVTHSTCINNLHTFDQKKLVSIDAGADKSYAVTVFLTISKESHKAYVLGYVYANDWENLSYKMMKFAGANMAINKYLL